MKKICFALCLCAALLAGCGKAAPTPPPEETKPSEQTQTHTHSFTIASVKLEGHGKICECGEPEQLEAHVFDDDGICTICRCAVLDYGEGSYGVLAYDDQGTLYCQTEYDADGNVIYQHRQDIEYYDDGSVKHILEYLDDVLVSESTYLPCEDPANGDIYCYETISYHDDGTKNVMIGNEYSSPVSSTDYDENGNVTYTQRWEYRYDHNGLPTYTATYIDDVIESEVFAFVSSHGELLDSKVNYYDQDGNLSETCEYTYEFSDDGDITRIITHIDGVLSSETRFTLHEDGWYYKSSEILYDQDGNVEAEFFYDAEGNEVG